MNEVIRKDILSIVSDFLDLAKGHTINALDVSKLSNKTVHDASIYQDEDAISIAVVLYALSKIITRQGRVDSRILKSIRRAYNYLLDKDTVRYKRRIKDIFRLISQQDSQLKDYITEIVKQSQIKKGFNIYEHGISLARASEILGISQWELSSYIGNTTTNEQDEEGIPIDKRMVFARSLFAQ